MPLSADSSASSRRSACHRLLDHREYEVEKESSVEAIAAPDDTTAHESSTPAPFNPEPQKPAAREMKDPQQQIENRLSKMIDEKLDEIFVVSVKPMYQKMLADSAYRMNDRNEFIEAYRRGLDRLVAYGDTHSEEYPDR